MLFRRVVAFVLMVCTLHLTVQSVGSACETRALAGATHNASVSTADGMAHSMAHGMNMSSDHAGAHKGKPCELPAQSNCCRALISCGVAFSSNETLAVLQPVTSREMIVRNATIVPASEIVTPEPPPPKA